MSLQVWLPLNGNVDNQGLGTLDTSIVSSPTYVDGKMGKSLSLSNAKSTTVKCSELTGVSKFSVSFWFKLTGTTYTRWADIISLPTSSSGQFRLETNNTTGTSINWYGMMTDGGIGVIPITNNTWYHMAITVDTNSSIKVYLNGTLTKTHTMLDEYKGRTLLGTFSIGNAGMYCAYNDIRIYDEIISLKTIKELSKGLCLHYKLAGVGGENILKGSYDFTGKTAGSGVTTPNGFNGFSYKYLKYEGTSWSDCVQFSSCITPEPNTKYTVSFWAKGNCQIHNFFYPNACAKGVGSTGATGTAADGNTPIGLTSEWTKYWITWTTTASVSGAKNVLIGRIQNKGAGAECYIAGVKFEKGDKATPWTPNPADDLYSTLGLDLTTEYDCSGFGNDGTKVGTITASPNTIRHITSYNFPSAAYINCGTGAKVTDEITINAWCYMDTWVADPHICSCTESGGFNFENTNGNIKFVLCVAGAYKTASSSKTWASLSSGWHMFTGIYDGYNVKLYIDGVLDTTTATGISTKTPITYNASNSIFIHAEAAGDASTPTTTTYQPCNMSDFRIYATALSAQDIAELYNTPASIDKAGNLFAYDCIEGESNTTSITKQGAVKSYGLLEDESAKIGADSFTANALNEV